MSQEGEFQKIVSKHHEFKTGMTEQELIDYCYQPFIDLCKALDEARKEYPSLIGLGCRPKMNAEDIDKVLIARNQWYLKWFGGESK